MPWLFSTIMRSEAVPNDRLKLVLELLMPEVAGNLL